MFDKDPLWMFYVDELFSIDTYNRTFVYVILLLLCKFCEHKK